MFEEWVMLSTYSGIPIETIWLRTKMHRTNVPNPKMRLLLINRKRLPILKQNCFFAYANIKF